MAVAGFQSGHIWNHSIISYSFFFFSNQPIYKLALPNKFVQGIEKQIFGLLFLACFYYKNVSFGNLYRKKKNPIYLPTFQIVGWETLTQLFYKHGLMLYCFKENFYKTRDSIGHNCLVNWIFIYLSHLCLTLLKFWIWFSFWEMCTWYNFLW